MIKVELEHDFFSDDEFRRLSNNVYGLYDSLPKVEVEPGVFDRPKQSVVIERNLGRANCLVTNIIPKDIVKKILAKAEQYGEIDWYNFLFVKYSNDFGVPNLGPHLDTHDTNFSINFQLDSNIEWPVILEDEEYMLKTNSALTFSPSEVVHWRPTRDFFDNEFVDVILFYVVLKNGKTYTGEEKAARVNPYKDKFEEKFNER